MVRDLYAGDRAAQTLSTLITVMAVAPLLGPVIGGQILSVAGWRTIFWALVAIGLATLAALFTLPETLPAHRRNAEPLVKRCAAMARLRPDRRLLAFTGAGAFFYGGVYAYIAGTPFAFITYHHVAPQLYGVLLAIGILGIMATNLFNVRFVVSVDHQIGPDAEPLNSRNGGFHGTLTSITNSALRPPAVDRAERTGPS